MRESLERLGRYDDRRVRERFLSAFAPEHTYALEADRSVVGSIALRPAPEGTWIEHFYLHPSLQGNGIGSGVLRAITSAADGSAMTLWLDVLQRSEARRLYERHGFELDHEDPVDVYLRRLPARCYRRVTS
jgi:GNAT superfamily N-acetyltransferase